MTLLDHLISADAEDIARLGVHPDMDCVSLAGKWDNRPAWDNWDRKPPFKDFNRFNEYPPRKK